MLVNAPATAVIDLEMKGARDMLVNSSANIIKALLAADMLDRPNLMICPVAGRPRVTEGVPTCLREVPCRLHVGIFDPTRVMLAAPSVARATRD